MTDYESEFRLPDSSKLPKNCKNDNGVTIFRHDFIVRFFHVVLFFLSILVIGAVFFYKGLTRNPKIGSIEYCPICGDWNELGIRRFARMALIKCY